MRIDFVSDVTCPWCAIGLNALERALERIGEELGAVELHMQPFELNPTMAPEGTDATEYLTSKYRITAEQLAVNQTRIAERGADEGFTFGERKRVWNTFDAHRLLFWAGAEGPAGSQRALKHALLTAYHADGRNPSDRDVLLDLAEQASLPTERAGEVLEQGEFGEAVREAENFWQQLGIHSVPAVIIDRKHLFSGAYPSEVFEQGLRQIAAESDVAATR